MTADQFGKQLDALGDGDAVLAAKLTELEGQLTSWLAALEAGQAEVADRLRASDPAVTGPTSPDETEIPPEPAPEPRAADEPTEPTADEPAATEPEQPDEPPEETGPVAGFTEPDPEDQPEGFENDDEAPVAATDPDEPFAIDGLTIPDAPEPGSLTSPSGMFLVGPPPDPDAEPDEPLDQDADPGEPDETEDEEALLAELDEETARMVRVKRRLSHGQRSIRELIAEVLETTASDDRPKKQGSRWWRRKG